MRRQTPPAQCPACGAALARAESGPPWCPACEWNLGAYDPRVLPPRGWRWLERFGHRVAFRLDRALYARLSENRPTRPELTFARAVLVVLAALLYLADAAAAGFGGYLLVQHSSFWEVNLGVALLVLALVLRPRFGRVPTRSRRLDRARTPLLFELVDRVAAEVGAHPPVHIVLTLGDNAAIERCGMRGRTVLRIGGRLWVAMAPPQRVAMLAHEMGHTVSGDPNRGLVVQPVMTTFGRLAEWTGAERTLHVIFHPTRPRGNIFALFGELLLWAISRIFLVLHLGFTAIGMREHHRAEYLADAICVDVAGTDATVGLMDLLLHAESVERLLYHTALHRQPGHWRGTVEAFLHARQHGFALQRQHSARTISLWDSHPPAGRRAQMLLAWPHQAPRLTLTDAQSQLIDAQLHSWIDAVHRDVLGTRDFVERRTSAARPEIAARLAAQRSEPDRSRRADLTAPRRLDL